MANVLSPLPEGFINALDVLELLPPKPLQHMVGIVTESLAQNISPYSVETVHKYLHDHGLQAELRDLCNGRRAIEHVFRVAIAKRVSPDKLSKSLSTFSAPDSSLHQTIVSQWNETAPILLGAKKGMPLLPTVKNTEWRLGVTVTPTPERSAEPAPAPSPFVEMKFHCLNPNRGHAVEGFHIPVAEFQDFAKEIDNLDRVLHTL
mmetsp:Transcript_26468/g.50262  ORF Transcript_26468/g.50262 Transcript_26468/m.50262 type:complete len:204 (+) Transcript_26468:181-792(+)